MNKIMIATLNVKRNNIEGIFKFRIIKLVVMLIDFVILAPRAYTAKVMFKLLITQCEIKSHWVTRLTFHKVIENNIQYNTLN